MFYLVTFAKEQPPYLNTSDIIVLSQEDTFQEQFKAIRLFLQDKHPTDIVCITKIKDMIQLGTNTEIQTKFRQMKVDLLFTAETICRPWNHVQKLYPFSPTVYKYLNSAGYMGYVHALKTLLEDDFTKSPCEQGYFTYKFLNDYPKYKIRLDINCTIFQNIEDIPLREFKIQDGRLWNQHTQTKPCLLYAPSTILPSIHHWINTITDRIYSLETLNVSRNVTHLSVLPESSIIQLAKENAKRYVKPDSSRILQRDQDNHHAILQGTTFVRPIQKMDFQGQWAHGNRKIIEEFFKWVNVPGTQYLDISLHDYVGYQSNTKEWPHSIFGFSTQRSDRHNILIPDLYAMQDYKNSIHEDKCQSKIQKLLFIGSTTGKASVQENERIQLCLYAYNKPWIEGYISSVVNFNPPNIYHILHDPMTIPEQLQYQHLVVVDGNTACWDRLPWVLASKSVCWKMESEHQCWYYPFLKPWIHYIPFTLDNLEETWYRVKDDVELHKKIIQNANQFFQTYLTRQAHGLYLYTLLNDIYAS